jgi:hypothetical protein
MYREIYMSQRRVEQHAVVMRGYPDTNIVVSFSDHDSGDRAILERQGVPTVKANKEIEQGLQTVKSLLAQDRVYFFRGALIEVDTTLTSSTKRVPTCTTEEFGVYVWAKASSGKNDKEFPVDKDNHGMDAMRYMLHTHYFQNSGQRLETLEVKSRVGGGERNWSGMLTRNRNWSNI